MMVQTRGTRGRAYTLLTPDNHYASRLPNLPGAQVIKLVTPRLAPARLAQYLVAAPQAPMIAEVAPGFENFFFVLEGTARLDWPGGAVSLTERGFAYISSRHSFTLRTTQGPARALWIKRRYEPWGGLDEPEEVTGSAAEVPADATATPGLHRRELLAPTEPRYDFNMSLMSFEPGVGLPQVEIHDEEHGLYMTAGGGEYLLDGDAHPVQAGDFIYMAPYCPQGFAASGDGAEYLLYKDVYRDGF